MVNSPTWVAKTTRSIIDNIVTNTDLHVKEGFVSATIIRCFTSYSNSDALTRGSYSVKLLIPFLLFICLSNQNASSVRNSRNGQTTTFVVLYFGTQLSNEFPYMFLLKIPWSLGRGRLSPKGYNLNDFCRGPLENATCQLSRSWSLWF